MKRSSIISLALINLVSAQDSSSVSTDDLLFTIQTNTDLPPTSIITVPEPTISDVPGQTITSLPSFTGTITNDVPYSSISQDGCTYVTAQGDPVFTIQTDTSVPAGCTITVYPGSSSSSSGYFNTTTTAVTGRNTTTVVLTSTATNGGGGGGEQSSSSSSASESSSNAAQSSSSTSDATAPTSTGNPANKLALGSGGVGLAVIAGMVAWL